MQAVIAMSGKVAVAVAVHYCYFRLLYFFSPEH
jgi:hypothetical protein